MQVVIDDDRSVLQVETFSKHIRRDEYLDVLNIFRKFPIITRREALDNFFAVHLSLAYQFAQYP